MLHRPCDFTVLSSAAIDKELQEYVANAYPKASGDRAVLGIVRGWGLGESIPEVLREIVVFESVQSVGLFFRMVKGMSSHYSGWRVCKEKLMSECNKG